MFFHQIHFIRTTENEHLERMKFERNSDENRKKGKNKENVVVYKMKF